MNDPRKAHFRATRTTPDPYPPHSVLVFTDKELEVAKRASGLPVKDFNGFEEMAFGSELSDWIDLTVPRFTATLNPSGEECLIYTDLLLGELEILSPTECIEIQHRSAQGPKQMVPRGQLDGIVEGAPVFVEEIISAPLPEPVPIGAARSARRKLGRSS